MIAVREALLPADTAAIATIDTAFATDRVFDVQVDARGFSLIERNLTTPISKRFPLDDLDDPERRWSLAFVAEEASRCVGFAAIGFEPWNRRATLWHLYVAADARRRGVARALIDRVLEAARQMGARHIWLETSHLNAPGVAAYEALGFQLTGIDLTLYDGTPAEGEIAFFFSRPIA